MKRIVLYVILFLVSLKGIFAQAPEQFNYQAVMRNGEGLIVANEDVTVDIYILKGSTEGTSVFDEQHNVTTSPQGLINLIIGSESDLSPIDWGADEYFLKVSIDGTLLGITQLLSVPYALYAENTGIWSKEDETVYLTNEVGNSASLPYVDLYIFDDDHSWLTIETESSNKWALSDLRTPDSELQFSLLGNDATGGGVILKNTANIDAIAPGGLNIINESESYIAFHTNGYQPSDEKMRLTSEGNLGIGNISPAEKLEVNGAVKIGNGGYTGISDGVTTPVPDGGAGTIVFSDAHFYGWDGSTWKQLDL